MALFLLLGSPLQGPPYRAPLQGPQRAPEAGEAASTLSRLGLGLRALWLQAPGLAFGFLVGFLVDFCLVSAGFLASAWVGLILVWLELDLA